jgi:hypothetical protein
LKRIRAIAWTTLRLLFRNGTGWGVLAAIAVIGSFIFFSARADDVLLHELRLRIRYGTTFYTVFLAVCLLFSSCLSVRLDIDRKLMHILTSYPVHRYEIWCGKWLGLMLFSVLGLCVGMVSVGFSATWYVAANSVDRSGLSGFWRCHRVCHPEMPSLDLLVEREHRLREREGRLPTDRSSWQIRSDLRTEIRRQTQLLETGEKRTWTFDLGKGAASREELLLEYSFFAQEQRRLVRGIWLVEAEDGPGQHTETVEAFPYTVNRVTIPISCLSESGRVRVTFQGIDAPHLIFARGKGIRLFLEDGSFWSNTFRGHIVVLLHFGAIVALGMTVATAFTFPVAAFVSTVFYLLAAATGFFESVARDLDWGEPGVLRTLSDGVIRGGVWLTRGLRLPPVIGRVSGGTSVEFGSLVSAWGAQFIVYAIVVGGLGMWWLTRKELDRLH